MENASVKLPNLSDKETAHLIPKGVILSGYRGSRAHNTYVTPTDPSSIDDIDLMSVYVAPLQYYLGLSGVGKNNRGTKEAVLDPYDAVSYEIRKFVYLLLKGNPNVLSLLWLRENMYIFRHRLGKMLITYRDSFVSKQAYHSFIGYAHGQLHRMTHGACKGRMGAKRKALVEKHGYDTKNAGHLIRLLRMGIEFLTEGALHIWRKDAHELKEIKRGLWTLDKVKSESDRLFKLAEEAYIRSHLPAQPNWKQAEEMTIAIIKMFHNIK